MKIEESPRQMIRRVIRVAQLLTKSIETVEDTSNPNIQKSSKNPQK